MDILIITWHDVYIRATEAHTMTLDKRFARIMQDLEEITNDLEARGFEAHADALDGAASKIEAVKETFQGL
jgi:hypothetical protein